MGQGSAKPGRPEHIRPERVMAGGFLLLILAGAGLLALPVCAQSGVSIGLPAALFTSASAVCVTGLTVVDTGAVFSLCGQIVLLMLIQTGGLGFMVFATLIMAALGRRISLRSRLLIRESMNTASLAGLVRLSGWYGMMALMIELGGALLLSLRFVPAFGLSRGLYFSLWHSVSAFCNAGFDLFGGFRSLTDFRNDPPVLLTVAALIILGGTGFSVMAEAAQACFRRRGMSLHGKLVLLTTAGLLLAGTAGIALLEWDNPKTLGALDEWGGKALNAFFQSASMRTAGFNSIDLSAMSDAAKLLCVLLMFVGASPASTGGGVKTTTMALLFLTVRSAIRGNAEITVMKRRLSPALVRRALAVVSIMLLALLTGTLAVAAAEDGRISLIDLLFETTSASATVGVSSAGTVNLTEAGRCMLVPMMYLGRVGPLTLATALARRQGTRTERLRYPEEEIAIG